MEFIKRLARFVLNLVFEVTKEGLNRCVVYIVTFDFY